MKLKGFTLIDLLVVISIIGMRSGVVLSSFNTARNKSRDAAIRQGLSNLRGQAGLYHLDNGASYGTRAEAACPATFTAGTSIFGDQNAFNIIQSAYDDAGGAANSACSSDGTNYAVAVQLRTNTAQAFCVDSAGKASVTTNTPANAITNSLCN